MDDSRGVSRRHFIALTSGIALPIAFAGCRRDKPTEPRKSPAAVAGPPPDDAIAVLVADHPELAKDGGFVTLEAAGAAPSLLLVREGDAVRVFANMCTHQSCALDPVEADGVIYCDRNCGHGSIYSMAGEVIAGPSLRSLYEFESWFVDDGQRVLLSLVLKEG